MREGSAWGACGGVKCMGCWGSREGSAWGAGGLGREVHWGAGKCMGCWGSREGSAWGGGKCMGSCEDWVLVMEVDVMRESLSLAFVAGT